MLSSVDMVPRQAWAPVSKHAPCEAISPNTPGTQQHLKVRQVNWLLETVAQSLVAVHLPWHVEHEWNAKPITSFRFLVNDMFEYNPEHADSQHSVWKWKAGSEPCWLFMCMHLLRHSMASLVPSACLLWIFIHETVPLQLTVELVMNTVMKPLCPYCVFLPLCVSVCVCLCTVRYSTRHNPATTNWVFTYLFHMAEVVVYGSQIRTILHSSRVWRLVSFVSVSKTKKKCKRAWSVN